MSVLIGKGAEADLFLSEGVVSKVRNPKSYRLKVLDGVLRKSRTLSEAKILQKVGDLGPGFISSNSVDELKMHFVSGVLVRDVLNKNVFLANMIGFSVAKLHDLNVVHGDLTTSNMIFSDDGNLKIIDFGLSFISDKVEDKAVDLHLFKEAVISKHFAFEKEIWTAFLEGYNANNRDFVLKRLSLVESRGRNKLKY